MGCECCCKTCKEYTCPLISITVLSPISMVLTVIAIILCKINKFDGDLCKNIADDLKENLNRGYILKIVKCSSPYNNLKIYNSSSDLNRESNDNIIEFGKWPGTVRGCGKIKKNNKTSVRILDDINEECDEDEETLNKIPEQKIISYKGISICGLTKGNYLNLLNQGAIVEKNEICPEGKKSCGIIDSIDNILCIDNNEDCPISYIK